MTAPVRIAQLPAARNDSGVQEEINTAAKSVNGEIFYPDVALKDIIRDFDAFGLEVRSPDLKLCHIPGDGACRRAGGGRCGLYRDLLPVPRPRSCETKLRRYILEHSNLPVVSYSFTERTTAGTLLTRMEALTTIARRRALLAREVQEGITLGIDSGSSTTKAVVMKDNKIIGTGWQPTTEVLKCAREVVEHALAEAGIKREEIQAIGTTGYGRFLVGKDVNADLIQEELTVNSKGAVYLADKQHGPVTVIDIGGMDNKAITVMDGIPGTFTMGGICAGASGRFSGDDRETSRRRYHRTGAACDERHGRPCAHEQLLYRVWHPEPRERPGCRTVPARMWQRRPATVSPNRSSSSSSRKWTLRSP